DRRRRAGQGVGRRPLGRGSRRGRRRTRRRRRAAGRLGGRDRRRRAGPQRGGWPVKKVMGAALGILTAIGGFVDIGDLVTNAVVGSRFGLSLAWVVAVGVVGICLFASMAGRVAAVSGRATFEAGRERLGPRAAGPHGVPPLAITLPPLAAELRGIPPAPP